MQPSVKALIWYCWRRSRVNLAYLIAMSGLVTGLLVAGRHANWENFPCAFLNLVVQVVLVSTITGSSPYESRRDRLVLPAFLMTLPVASIRYVGVFHGYVFATAALFSCVATAVHWALFGDAVDVDGTTYVIALWQTPFLCICLASMFQTAGTMQRMKKELESLFLTCVMVSLFAASAVPLFAPGEQGERAFDLLPLVALLIFSWLASYRALSANRCDDGTSFTEAFREGLKGMFANGEGRSRAFNGPSRALFWLHWQQMGRLFVWSISALFLLCIVLIVTSAYFSPTDRLRPMPAEELLQLACIWILLPYALCSLGYILVVMSKDDPLLLKASGTFYGTLPLSNGLVSRNWLTTMACSIALSTVVALALFLLFRLFAPEPAIPVLRVVVAFLATAAAAWLALAFGFLSFLSALLWLPAAFFWPLVPAFTLLSTLAAIVVPAGAIAISMASMRRRLLDRRSWQVMGLLLIPSGGASACALMAGRPWSIPCAVLALLIPLPFAAVPLALDSARHR